MIERFFLSLIPNYLTMRKFYILCISIFTIHTLSAQNQNENVEKKGLLNKEMKSYAAKMAAGNTNPNTFFIA